jgi:hypothetical protein
VDFCLNLKQIPPLLAALSKTAALDGRLQSITKN